VVCATAAQQIVFQEYVRAVTEQQDRRQRLEPKRHTAVKAWRWYPVVEAIQALRGTPALGPLEREVRRLALRDRISHDSLNEFIGPQKERLGECQPERLGCP
jgi:hypothetical protein